MQEIEFREADVRALYRLLGHRKEEYTDVRVIDVNKKGSAPLFRKLVQGEEEFVAVAKRWNGEGNVFVGRNPRSADAKVCRIGCFTLDLDPERDPGTAANVEMVRRSREAAKAILASFPNGYIAESGNGALLLWRLGIDVSKEQSEQALKTLQKEAQKFCPEVIKVDETHDAARLIKVIGTMSTKGNRKDWRVSRFLSLPNPPYSIFQSIEKFLEGQNDLLHQNGEGRVLPKQGLQISPTVRLQNAEDALKKLGTHRAENYDSWLKVGFALKEFGDVGLQLWREWSKRSVKYQDGACESKWASMQRSILDGDPKLTSASLVKWAEEDNTGGGLQLVGNTGGLDDELDDLDKSLGESQDVKWLAYPFVARGSIVFTAGLPETLKTWICSDLAIEVARGGKWLGVVPTEALNVLFINQERFSGEGNRRFSALLSGKGLQADSLRGSLFIRHGNGLSLDNSRSVERLCKWIEKKKLGLIVVDSFATVHKQDENSRIGMQGVLDTIKSIRDKYGCSFVFIDHENKTAFSDGREGVSANSYRMVGTVGKVAAAEAVMVVKRNDNDSAIIYHTKSTLAKASDPIQVRITDVDSGVVVRAIQ